MVETIESLSNDIEKLVASITEKGHLRGKLEEAVAAKIGTRDEVQATIDGLNLTLADKRARKDRLIQTEGWRGYIGRTFFSPSQKKTPSSDDNSDKSPAQKKKFKPQTLFEELVEEVHASNRLDHKDNWPFVSQHANGIYIICGGRTNSRCEKCEIALHPKYVKMYHRIFTYIVISLFLSKKIKL